jgi:N-acetylneuraminic acid mutarotase
LVGVFTTTATAFAGGSVIATSLWPARVRPAVIATIGALTGGLLVPVLAGAAAAAGGSGPPNTWAATAGPMGVARSGGTATLLPDGRVLVAGGGTANAELYDPASRTFAPTAPLPAAVTDATATLLPDGTVLLAGGFTGGHQLASAELYDPASGTWSATGSMTVARSGHTATLLPGGQVLVAGGGCNGSAYGCNSGSFEAPLSSAELYNPATGTWARTGSMRSGRQFHTATLLQDGQVLAAGGFAQCDDSFCSDNSSAELYNPATGKWTGTGSLKGPREQHSATLLPDGEVLVAGGLNEGGFSNSFTYSSAELYNPATGKWSATASMPTALVGQTATLLRDGQVLVAGGGTAAAEIYQPQRAIWVSPGAMSTARTHQTATLLPNGHVLVTGGLGPDGRPQATAEEFLAGPGPLVSVTPGAIAFGGQLVGGSTGVRTYTITNVGSADLRAGGAAVTGTNPGDYRATTNCAKAPVASGGRCTVRVRFVPAATGLRTAAVTVADNAPGSPHGVSVTGFGGGPNAWVPVGPMTTARDDFTATLLPDGTVLVAGGETSIANPVATAELYNPATRSFAPTGSLGTARDLATAVLLRNGQVLVAGGLNSNLISIASAELYNPATGTWRATTPMNAAGFALTSTLLRDGSVLVTGQGVDAEVYDPATATWTNTGPMTASPGLATATLLHNGKVLLAGGGTAAAELYNSATNTWTATGSMHVARQGGTATLLPDGKVLVAGGEPPTGGSELMEAELYHPTTGTWQVTGTPFAGRFGEAATLLPNGVVLVTGGCTGGCSNRPALSSTEGFNGGFWFPDNAMTQPRVFHTATLLPGGSVLVAGGDPRFSSAAVNTAELFTPSLLSVSPASGTAGSQVTLTGSGFYAGEPVTFRWDGAQIFGKTVASATGAFTTTVTIPQTTMRHNQILAQGRRSFATAITMFTITR